MARSHFPWLKQVRTRLLLEKVEVHAPLPKIDNLRSDGHQREGLVDGLHQFSFVREDAVVAGWLRFGDIGLRLADAAIEVLIGQIFRVLAGPSWIFGCCGDCADQLVLERHCIGLRSMVPK